jgi:phage terminase large subunit-like protein
LAKSLLARAIDAAGGAEAFRTRVGPKMAAAIVRRVKLLGAPIPGDEPVPWRAIGRPEQLLPPGNWSTLLLLAGRGNGKSRTLSESAIEWAKTGRRRLAIVAPTAGDARDVAVEGESGISAVSQADGFPVDYESSKRRLTWPNGAIATLYSAEEPDRLRGPQHDGALCDELAAWNDPQGTWDMLQFGLRLGDNPQSIVATTPRPIPTIRKLIADETTLVMRGSTFDNSENLAETFLTKIKAVYEGTRLGRQELYAEILEDNPGALWKLSNIEATRVRNAPIDFRRVAGAIDPAVTSRPDSDESGIIFGGIADCMCKGFSELHAFILEDASGIYAPDQWARIVAEGYHRHGCDRIIAEINNGGEMVEATLRTLGDANISYRGIHASRGKAIRAEPVAALSEQGKIHFVGTFAKLEDQLVNWNPLVDSYSPDRLDAFVWLLTELLVSHSNYPSIFDVVS